ncbi:MAG: DUF3450 domain-containing protein [Thalassotalea sp.]|nr:DUF3450 domain-containing protein [Thalassotalea sp.]
MGSRYSGARFGVRLLKFCFLPLIVSAMTSFAQAELSANRIDQLTKQWLETERQTSLLKANWQVEKPLLEQRIKLLNIEKDQLNSLLEMNQVSTSEVEQKRESLLEQQAKLESEQAMTANAIDPIRERLDSIEPLLPPPLQEGWQSEPSDNNAVVLEQQLTRLSRLKDFNERITLHAMRLPNEQGDDVLVKQLYLGLSQAWFSSQNGQFKGYGLAENGVWQWHFSQTLDSQQILDAIAIVENQKTASDIVFDIKQLPSGVAQ